MSIFIDENIPFLKGALAKCGEVITFSGRKLTNIDLAKNNCEYLFVRSTTKVNKELLSGLNIKLVGTATSGTDHVDLEYLRNNNIDFAAAPGSNANSVAEYVFYGILKWAFTDNIDFQNKTIGIIGYGNIGKIVAKYADCFGMKIFINDPPLKDNNFDFPDYVEYCELNYLLENSDIITNHVPLTKEERYPTYKLLNRGNLSLIKNGSLIIHASRGYVIEEEYLIEKLRKNEIKALIDVWENEPLINPEPAKLAIISTPHIAGYSRDGKLRGVMRMAEAFQKYSGLSVNPEELKIEMAPYTPLDKSAFSNPEMIFDLLKEKRKLDEDSGAFLNTMSLPDKQRAEMFDKLRKNYPVRRESL